MDPVGRKEKVGCTQRVKWKLTLPYLKYIANGNLLCDPGNSNRGSVTTVVCPGERYGIVCVLGGGEVEEVFLLSLYI